MKIVESICSTIRFHAKTPARLLACPKVAAETRLAVLILLSLISYKEPTRM